MQLMVEIKDLEEKLKALESQIADYEKQMPAHGTKPAMMARLLDLEDERGRILDQLRHLKSSQQGD
jgi:hypothetical protein